MPQLDHYNFTFSYYCFVILFIITICLMAIIYLPMFFQHQKVKEYHIKELIAINKIYEIEKNLLINVTENKILNIIKKK